MSALAFVPCKDLRTILGLKPNSPLSYRILSDLSMTPPIPSESLVVGPGPKERTVLTANRQVLDVPAEWDLLPPGDAGLTRRVKAAGPTWTVQQRRGRKIFSLGVWAPRETIETLRAGLAAARDTPAYAARLASSRRRRDREQVAYVDDFRAAVLQFLAFAPCYQDLAERLATAIAAHATPVGSGTVARTERIPIEQRAEAAVIAWLRHQTTGYDDMSIPRIRGARREVRRQLAARSRELLQSYRVGRVIAPTDCRLEAALRSDRKPYVPDLDEDEDSVA